MLKIDDMFVEQIAKISPQAMKPRVATPSPASKTLPKAKPDELKLSSPDPALAPGSGLQPLDTIPPKYHDFLLALQDEDFYDANMAIGANNLDIIQHAAEVARAKVKRQKNFVVSDAEGAVKAAERSEKRAIASAKAAGKAETADAKEMIAGLKARIAATKKIDAKKIVVAEDKHDASLVASYEKDEAKKISTDEESEKRDAANAKSEAKRCIADAKAQFIRIVRTFENDEMKAAAQAVINERKADLAIDMREYEKWKAEANAYDGLMKAIKTESSLIMRVFEHADGASTLPLPSDLKHEEKPSVRGWRPPS